MAAKRDNYEQLKRKKARSAAQGAFFCWAVAKGGVLCFLTLKDGDLVTSLQSGAPSYAALFLFFYFMAVVLYLCLQKADPGFLTTEEHRTLLGDGESRRSTDSDSCHGVEMHEGIMAVPLRTEPAVTTSVSREMQQGADEVASDTDEMHAAEDFLDKLSQRLERPPPAQRPSPVEKTPQGAVDEGEVGNLARRCASDVPVVATLPVEERDQHQEAQAKSESLDEITLAVHNGDAGVGAVDQSVARQRSSPRTCEHCKTKQPLRTKHCYDCGRCVATFDHHCFWIGNCVGEKNHSLFWWYLLCETITLAWACSLIASTFFYTNGANFLSTWFMLNTPSLLCLLMCLGFLLMLSALLFFHTYLIYTGQTTWEVTRPKQIR